VEIASRDIIPAVAAYVGELAKGAKAKLAVAGEGSCRVEKDLINKLSELNTRAYEATDRLRAAEAKAAGVASGVKRAEAYRDQVIPAMEKLRSYVDRMEVLTSSAFWPLPTYGEMMFNV